MTAKLPPGGEVGFAVRSPYSLQATRQPDKRPFHDASSFHQNTCVAINCRVSHPTSTRQPDTGPEQEPPLSGLSGSCRVRDPTTIHGISYCIITTYAVGRASVGLSGNNRREDPVPAPKRQPVSRLSRIPVQEPSAVPTPGGPGPGRELPAEAARSGLADDDVGCRAHRGLPNPRP